MMQNNSFLSLAKLLYRSLHRQSHRIGDRVLIPLFPVDEPQKLACALLSHLLNGTADTGQLGIGIGSQDPVVKSDQGNETDRISYRCTKDGQEEMISEEA